MRPRLVSPVPTTRRPSRHDGAAVLGRVPDEGDDDRGDEELG